MFIIAPFFMIIAVGIIYVLCNVWSLKFVEYVPIMVRKINLYSSIKINKVIIYYFKIRKRKKSQSIKVSNLIQDFAEETIVLEQGQVPFAGFSVIHGNIDVFDGSKKIGSIGPDNVLGLVELMRNHGVKYSFRARPGSEILIIPRSSINPSLYRKY